MATATTATWVGSNNVRKRKGTILLLRDLTVVRSCRMNGRSWTLPPSSPVWVQSFLGKSWDGVQIRFWTKEDEVLVCCSWTNIQILTKDENQHTGSRVCPEHYSDQQLHLLDFVEKRPEKGGEVHADMQQSQIWLQGHRAQVL